MIFLKDNWKWILGIVLFLIWSVFLAIFFNKRGKNEAEMKYSQYEAKNEEYEFIIDSLTILSVEKDEIIAFKEEKDKPLKVKQKKLIDTKTNIKAKYEDKKFRIINSPLNDRVKSILSRYPDYK